jgi:hypothetical protein
MFWQVEDAVSSPSSGWCRQKQETALEINHSKCEGTIVRASLLNV